MDETETKDLGGAFQARSLLSPESIAELRAKLRAAVGCNFKCPHGERTGYCDACDDVQAAFADAARSYMQLLLDDAEAARAWRKEAEAAIRWALGEAPLPDGRWFDAGAFGLHDRVPKYWWRRFLRLHSGLGE